MSFIKKVSCAKDNHSDAKPDNSSLLRLDFVDWMKAVGITIIVLNHVVSRPFEYASPPVPAKQLGVAFFFFVLGYTLTRDSRQGLVILVRRSFDIFIYGIAFAILVTVTLYLSSHRLGLSNYLPFIFGANVFFNNFPANPSTWFIGTYLHFLLLWIILLRRFKISLLVVGVTAIAEVVFRYIFAQYFGSYIAYMLITNWSMIFFLGAWMARLPQHKLKNGFVWLRCLAVPAFILAWWFLLRTGVERMDFPWQTIRSIGFLPGDIITSLCVTLLYGTYTLLVYRACIGLPAPEWIRFLARNSLLIFILHMPVYYALVEYLRSRGASYSLRSFTLVLICLPGLAVFSEALRRLFPLKVWRENAVNIALTVQAKSTGFFRGSLFLL